jgi:hypothetical protein
LKAFVNILFTCFTFDISDFNSPHVIKDGTNFPCCIMLSMLFPSGEPLFIFVTVIFTSFLNNSPAEK